MLLLVIKGGFHEAVKVINYFGTQESLTPWASVSYKSSQIIPLFCKEGRVQLSKVKWEWILCMSLQACSQVDQFYDKVNMGLQDLEIESLYLLEGLHILSVQAYHSLKSTN